MSNKLYLIAATPIERVAQAAVITFAASDYALGYDIDTTRQAVTFYVYQRPAEARNSSGETPNAIAQWTTTQFPNCRAIAVTTSFAVDASKRGQGIGRTVARLRAQAYALAGFKLDLATVRHDNKPMKHLKYSLGGVIVDWPHTNQDGNVIRFMAVDVEEASNV